MTVFIYGNRITKVPVVDIQDALDALNADTIIYRDNKTLNRVLAGVVDGKGITATSRAIPRVNNKITTGSVLGMINQADAVLFLWDGNNTQVYNLIDLVDRMGKTKAELKA